MKRGGGRCAARWGAAIAAAALLVAGGCAVTRPRPLAAAKPAGVAPAPTVAAAWGVQIAGVRRTAAGRMIDVRFRIVDPDKAVDLVDRRIDAWLVDEASGRAVGVPRSPNVGPLRQTTRYGAPPQGRELFLLFANPGRLIERGNRVTLVVGDVRIPGLVVE